MSNRMRGHRRALAACVAASCVLAGVAGCASPYGENTLFGGYRSDRLDASHWRVQYDGNGNTAREQVWAYWIYRCAEVTRQNGYAYFAMLPADWKPSVPPQAAVPAPTAWPTWPQGAPLARPAVWTTDGNVRPVQVRSSGGGGFVYIPGSSYTIHTWHTKGVVAMVNAPAPADTLLVMSAQSVLDDLAPYVHGDVKHPIDRDELVAHGLRWVNESGAVLPLMAPPAAPASAPRSPASYAAPPRAPARQPGLAS